MYVTRDLSTGLIIMGFAYDVGKLISVESPSAIHSELALM